MNDNWLNNKFNIIKVSNFKTKWKLLPINYTIHTDTLTKSAFNIRQYELENDEVFTRNAEFMFPKKYIKNLVRKEQKKIADKNNKINAAKN